MTRLLILLVLLALVAFGFSWLADHPGGLTLAFGDLRVETSLPVALAALLVAFLALWFVVALARLLIGAPSLLSAAGRSRNRQKGRQALATGMIAAAAGDLHGAERASLEAKRRLPNEPLALLLEAQQAQLSGDRAAASGAFARMAERPDMRLLGLRGLHAEAVRAGDPERAYQLAARAHAIAPLPWAAQAVLDHHTSRQDWAAALAAVDANAAQKTIGKQAADRQRAVLLTATAMDLGERDPDQVLRLSQEALRLAPGLAPAAVLAASVLTRRQEIRKAAKTIEAAWRVAPHPDLARAYLGIRPGDSASDRLSRAETLARIDRDNPESHMIVARAALEARDFLKARRAMAPLIEDGRPTRRMCLLMADIEEAENGVTGALREWLARAARAPSDPAWVADGFVSDVWSPVSPITGRLDAFVWKTPDERLTAIEPPPPPVLPAAESFEPEPAAAEPPAAALTAPAPAPAPASALAPAETAADAATVKIDAAVQSGPLPDPPEASAEVARLAKFEPAGRSQTPRPVLFPHPQAPDDPGPEASGAERSDEARRLA